MTIFLIRHGRTDANEKHLYCGKTDLPLTDTGKAALKPITKPENCRFIISGLLRTKQTLEQLVGNVPYEVIPELQEMNFGRFEMQSYEQLKNDPQYIAWISGDNENNVAPGGESGQQMCERAIAAFVQIVHTGENALIITHGGVIAAIMAYLFPDEQKNRYQWQCANGSGYQLTFENDTWSYRSI